MLPAQQVIRSTLEFEGGVWTRNLKHMERVLKKFPTFCWVSPYSMSEGNIELLYCLGIEFHHAATCEELKHFLDGEFQQDFILVSDF